jgi:hypothetical protein
LEFQCLLEKVWKFLKNYYPPRPTRQYTLFRCRVGPACQGLLPQSSAPQCREPHERPSTILPRAATNQSPAGAPFLARAWLTGSRFLHYLPHSCARSSLVDPAPPTPLHDRCPKPPWHRASDPFPPFRSFRPRLASAPLRLRPTAALLGCPPHVFPLMLAKPSGSTLRVPAHV